MEILNQFITDCVNIDFSHYCDYKKFCHLHHTPYKNLYVNGLCQGTHLNKSSEKILRFVDGMLCGTCYTIDTFRTNNYIVSIDNFHHDQLHGVQYAFYWSGKRKYEKNYCHGVLHGKQMGWNEDGKLIHYYSFCMGNPSYDVCY